MIYLGKRSNEEIAIGKITNIEMNLTIRPNHRQVRR